MHSLPILGDRQQRGIRHRDFINLAISLLAGDADIVEVVIPPVENLSPLCQGKGNLVARCNLLDLLALHTAGRLCLAHTVAAPADNFPLCIQRHRMVKPCGDGNDLSQLLLGRQILLNIYLIADFRTPPHIDLSIVIQTNAKGCACRNHAHISLKLLGYIHHIHAWRHIQLRLFFFT